MFFSSIVKTDTNRFYWVPTHAYLIVWYHVTAPFESRCKDTVVFRRMLFVCCNQQARSLDLIRCSIDP